MTYILLTNDDGVHAPGLYALAMAMQGLVEKVGVIAPIENQSMVGHKITLHQDLPIVETQLPDGTPAIGVGGSPADCVALAALGVVDWPPRFVVSGINRGANMAQDVLYSGTVAAAAEAIIQGVPSLAVSLDYHQADKVEHYEVAARLAARVVSRAIQRSIPEFTILNLNVPYGVDVKGIRLTRQGIRIYRDQLERNGNLVKIAGATPTGVLDQEGTDLWAVHQGYASLTPLSLDFTAHTFMADLAAWDIAN
jgi:5'-nucleotidase